MKLFFWTENEPECCNHHCVVAESEEEARSQVIAAITKSCEPVPDSTDPWDEPEYCAKELSRALENFNDPTKWSLDIFEIRPGVIF